MTETSIRGYSLQQTASFIHEGLEHEERERVLQALAADTRERLDTFQPAEWYPRQHAIDLYRAIASIGDSEKDAYDKLVQCGEFIATEATNTFLKLMMKILTPTLFAKKLPEMWKRDQRSGEFEADLSKVEDSLITFRLTGIEGYEHIGIVSIGWLQFGMRALGKDSVQVKQSGWSLQEPGPERVEYEVCW